MSKRIVRDSSIATPAAPASVLTSAVTAISAVMEPPTAIAVESPVSVAAVRQTRKPRVQPIAQPARRFNATFSADDNANRQAELFYLQKQIQQQTQMVFILEDGERIQGVIEWYDRQSIKVRGKSRTLIYKSAIKYLYKAGEVGTAPTL